MTLPSLQRFTKSEQGIPGAGADVNLYLADTYQKYPIGQGQYGAAGEIYRYASFDGPVVQGSVVGPNLTNVAKSITTTAPVVTPVSVAAEYPILTNSVGSHYLECTLASVTANQYQGGKVCIAANSGAGYTYDIKGNLATGVSQSGAVRFQLVQPLQAGVSPNSSIIVAPSMFNDLVVVGGISTNVQVAGVTMTNIGTNSASVVQVWGWIQTKGAIGALEDNTTVTLANGQAVTASLNKPGMYTGYGQSGTVAYSIPSIGQLIQKNGTTGGYGVIYLILE